MVALYRLMGSSLAAVLLALGPAWSSPQVHDASVPSSPIVRTPLGAVEGTTVGALTVFKGIPYAQPPVGALRWKPPVPVLPWKRVRKATAYGPTCFQPPDEQKSIYSENPMPMSEDCLTLNIWAPRRAHNAPVFFWIHGGAFLTGANRLGMYDGSRLAARGIIVVTINYRLGVLGFLAHPGLSAESPLKISGNYGILDQIEALKWVKANIGAFGGDPTNVTIAGESAGALSVIYLLTSPMAHGLFTKAIAESSYMISMPMLKEDKYGAMGGEKAGVMLGKKLKAPNIAALRAIDASTLATAAVPVGVPAAAPAAGFAPSGVIDGHVLPGQPFDIFEKGRQARVPILIGFNAGEIRSLGVLVPPLPASATDYEETIRNRYRDLAGEFLRLYPSTDVPESVLATARDATYGWTAEEVARKQTAIGAPAYLYLFDHGYPAADKADLHAFHASELPYVFGTFTGTPPLWPKIEATGEELKFSAAMTDYWSSFVLIGKPQAAGGSDWPVFGKNHAYMHFTAMPQASDHLFPGMYELHEAVVCRRFAAGDIAWQWNVGVLSPQLPARRPQCK